MEDVVNTMHCILHAGQITYIANVEFKAIIVIQLSHVILFLLIA